MIKLYLLHIGNIQVYTILWAKLSKILYISTDWVKLAKLRLQDRIKRPILRPQVACMYESHKKSQKWGPTWYLQNLGQKFACSKVEIPFYMLYTEQNCLKFHTYLDAQLKLAKIILKDKCKCPKLRPQVTCMYGSEKSQKWGATWYMQNLGQNFTCFIVGILYSILYNG